MTENKDTATGIYKVQFVTSSPDQVRWGGNDDPDEHLVRGETYDVLEEEVHSFHTKLIIRGHTDKKFNSVSFEEI